MTQTVLILGGSGRFGRHATQAFRAAGWIVRQFDRSADELMDKAQGADVIVYGWNPSYDKWAAELPGLTRQVIAAARAAGATVIIPGNVYVFGKDAPERFAHDTPHAAQNPLGRLRVEMEEAWRASGVQTIVIRAGDFLDTEPSGNWFDLIIAKNAAKGSFRYPGNPDVPHAWAFLPDVARAAVMLAGRRAKLGQFEQVPFPGYTLSGHDLVRACGRALGRDMRLKRMRWLPVYAAAPFWKLGRGLIEMSYLWSMPHHLDGARMAELVAEFRATPLDQALRRALAHQDAGDTVAIPSKA